MIALLWFCCLMNLYAVIVDPCRPCQSKTLTLLSGKSSIIRQREDLYQRFLFIIELDNQHRIKYQFLFTQPTPFCAQYLGITDLTSDLKETFLTSHSLPKSLKENFSTGRSLMRVSHSSDTLSII